jgi:SH3 domain protein
MVTRMMKSLIELVPLSQTTARRMLLSKEFVQTQRNIVWADSLRYDAAHTQLPLCLGKFFVTLFKVNRSMTRTILLALVCFFATGPLHAADTRYVTDEFEVTMRSGTSTSNSIVRMLGSGEAVTVLEEDLPTKYSLVETASGKQGYVLTRFLMPIPAARQRLEELEARFEQQKTRLNQQSSEIVELKQSLGQEKADNSALTTTLGASERELTEVRTAAQDTLSILDQNKRLQTVVDDLRQEKAELSETNAELTDSTRLDWFLRGGAVSLIAFVIGILVTRIRWKKQDSWGSY